MKLYIYIVLISLFTYPLKHFGQSVHGMVYELDKDNKTVPLPGANVYWAGTSVGTTSDNQGHFSIARVKSSTKLVFSFVSYVNDTLDLQHADEKESEQAGELHVHGEECNHGEIEKHDEHEEHEGHDKHEVNEVQSHSMEHIQVILRNEKQLEEVRISGRSGAFHSSLEVAHVQNLTGVELHKAACCNLSESFETNASVDVAYSDAITGAKQIELLGLNGKYIQILTEKTPMVRGLATGYGLEYVPGTWMESISISKGTSSVVDGFEAITGQISVDYKKPEKGEKFFFNAVGNSMGKIEGNLNGRMFLDSAKKLSTMLLAHGEIGLMKGDYNTDGFSDHPVVKQVNIVNRWKYEPNDNLCLEMSLRGLGERREGGQTMFDGSIDGLADNYGVLVFSNRYELIAKAGYIFDRPATSLGFINSYVYHNQDNYIGRNEFFAQQNSYYGNLIFESYIGNTNHSYSTGLSYISDIYDQTFNALDFSKREIIPGAFLQYTYKIAEKATFLLGIRADHHNTFGWFYTPRFNFKYVFPGKYIVRVSAGKGYRSPNVLAENAYLLTSSRNLVFTENILQEEAWNYGLTFF
ncbi:MAG: TonB-dependent receptor [Bacteroidales bacterium]|nr:TonB-dependent receptor [Bacteroidales bacterium]